MTEGFEARVVEHRRLLGKRGFSMASEHMPPTGQAALWYQDVIHAVPRSGRDVAKQLARLAAKDSRVTIPWRSLTDAVGKADKAGHTRGYAERGVAALVEAGWLHVETIGQKRGAKTTFYLLPGDRLDHEPWWLDGDEDDLDEWLEWAA